MSQEKPTYDLMLLLDPAADGDQKKKIISDAETSIGKLGEVIGKHDYGVRKTTFEIKKKGEAEYHLIQFHVNDREALAKLDHDLGITDGVQRHRIIKLAPGVGAPPDLKAVATESAPVPESSFDEEPGDSVPSNIEANPEAE